MLLILSCESIYLLPESIFTSENVLLYVDFLLARLDPIDNSVDDFMWWHHQSYHIFNPLSIILTIKQQLWHQDFTLSGSGPIGLLVADFTRCYLPDVIYSIMQDQCLPMESISGGRFIHQDFIFSRLGPIGPRMDDFISCYLS